MGLLIESCHIPCCPRNISDEDNESDSEEDNRLAQIEYSRYVKTPVTNIEFPFKLKNLFKKQIGNPWKYYDEIETLGEGAYGIVKKVCLKNHKETIRAMKILPKENLKDDENGKKLMDEIGILKNLEHPNIIKIYEYFDDEENIYIISEFCDDGDLLSKMEKLHTINEIIVKFLMGQILNAVAYLHSNRVFHGDIKLENIMLCKTSNEKEKNIEKVNTALNEDKGLKNEIDQSFNTKTYKSKQVFNYILDMTDYEVKLIDFGCCKFLHKRKDSNLTGIVGTSIYCSPEVIDDLYNEKSDEWSCGVLMYILLCGVPPFQGKTEEEIFRNVKKCEVSFDHPEFKNVSENCKKLIKRLLEKNHKKRIKASEALHHEFFKENYNPSAMNQDIDKEDIEKLLEVELFPTKFHELIEAYLCYNFISKEEEKKLRKLFRYLDHKEKNRLMRSDFITSFNDNNIEYTEDDINRIMKAMDSDGNNSIEYQEFLRVMCDKNALHLDENLKTAFEAIDEDNKGYINVKDIKSFCFKSKEINENKFLNYLNKIGMNLDSQLNYDEFVDIIKGKNLATIIRTNSTKTLEKLKEDNNKKNINNEEIKTSE